MPTLEITVQVKQDGVQVAGFPYTRRVTVDEVQAGVVEVPQHADFSSGNLLPLNYIDTVQTVILTSDRQVSVTFDGSSFVSGNGFPNVVAGGLVIIIGSDLGVGSTGAVNINNQSGATATIRFIGAGT